MLLVVSAGCTLNQGTAFEQQFAPFPEGRDAIATFEVSSSHVLPGPVMRRS